MTNERTCANNDASPNIQDLHQSALVLAGLVQAMDEMAELLGRESGPVYSCIKCARPLAEQIATQLDELI